MIGWWITVRKLGNNSFVSLACWTSPVGGLQWLDELLKDGRAIQLWGNGYPSRYIVQAKFAFHEMLTHKPTNISVDEKEFREGDTIIHHERIKSCVPDDFFIVDAWDRS